jgi:hypothetical protein
LSRDKVAPHKDTEDDPHQFVGAHGEGVACGAINIVGLRHGRDAEEVDPWVARGKKDGYCAVVSRIAVKEVFSVMFAFPASRAHC